MEIINMNPLVNTMLQIQIQIPIPIPIPIQIPMMIRIKGRRENGLLFVFSFYELLSYKHFNHTMSFWSFPVNHFLFYESF
jgi:hypothetical protein